MRVLIVGGQLQGVEAAYLAAKAGWETYLVDKEPGVPASGLCMKVYTMDICSDPKFRVLCLQVDLILPALEDLKTLSYLQAIAKEVGVPLAFDGPSYTISRSKLISDRLFQRIGIPAPLYWPQCELPVIAKPGEASGSNGVRKLASRAELLEFLDDIGDSLNQWVLQEYLEGPAYSLEVIGLKGEIVSLEVTELGMDQSFDCATVITPSSITPVLEQEFRAIGVRIAKMLQLTGIMDIEVICHEGQLKVLEIDARLPSQTPTAVYQTSGINILSLLSEVHINGTLPQSVVRKKKRAVIYEHIRVSPFGVQHLGEHIMTEGGPLHFHPDFFGADEAITNYQPQKGSWVATLIFTGDSVSKVQAKRRQVLEKIEASCSRVG